MCSSSMGKSTIVPQTRFRKSSCHSNLLCEAPQQESRPRHREDDDYYYRPPPDDRREYHDDGGWRRQDGWECLEVTGGFITVA